MSKRRRAEKLIGKTVRDTYGYGRLMRIDAVKAFSAQDLEQYVAACHNIAQGGARPKYSFYGAWFSRMKKGGLFLRFTWLNSLKEPEDEDVFPEGMFMLVNSRIRYQIVD